MIDKETGLTQARLREALRYDPETGVWTWRITPSANRKAGDAAGDLKPSGYVLIGLDGFRYRAHRLAWFYMTGKWPADQIDHRDGVRSHNWWSNLRPATNAQNQANTPVSKNNRSGFKGVYEFKRTGRWRAKINVGPKQIHLGTFDTPAEANAAYAEAAKRYFGEFARAA